MPSTYSIVAEALPESLRAALIEDATGYVFAAPIPRAGGAFAMASLAEPAGAPRRFADWLATTPEWASVDRFVPNEASYQRYSRDGNGLPPHRDQRYYVHAIAIATLHGDALFAVHGSASRTDVIAQWRTEPGQVVLLRGWNPNFSHDPRPYHRVDAPVAPNRLMLQLRQNVGADRTPPPPRLHAAEMEQARHLAAMPEADRVT